MLRTRSGRGPRRLAVCGGEAGEGTRRQLFPRHVCPRLFVGLFERDAWHAEEGLAGFLGAFDVGDLEESFG